MTGLIDDYLEEEEGITLNEYQDLALESAIYDPKYAIVYPALKLSGEAGEVSEKIGKRLRDADGDMTDPKWLDSVAKELGDVLWYIAALAHDIGWSLEGIADLNLEKLASRAARGVLQGSGDDR
jgi:NTP pyrophosphatase (non-canonical NTP hydrolase)